MRIHLAVILFLLLLVFLAAACAPQLIQELGQEEAPAQQDVQPQEEQGQVQDGEQGQEQDSAPATEPLQDQVEVQDAPPATPQPSVNSIDELESVLEDLREEEHSEPILYHLLQRERGVYTLGRNRYTIYFQDIVSPDEVELRIEGVTKYVKLGQSVPVGNKYDLTLVSILFGRDSTTGDLVKFYYGTREGMIADYIEEGETRTYLKAGKKYVITLATVSNPPEPKAVFEINGESIGPLDIKDQEIFDDKSFLFVSNIFSNEAGEYSTQKAVEFTILEK